MNTGRAKRPEYRSIGLVGNHSFTLVLPKEFAKHIGLNKGDFVKVIEENNKIVVERVN